MHSSEGKPKVRSQKHDRRENGGCASLGFWKSVKKS